MPDSHRSATRWLVIVLAGASAALWMAAQRTRDRRLLINQLTSRVPGSAAEAVRVLRFYGWLRPADLQTAAADGANLWLADLSRLDLGGIDLSRTNLTQADLSWSHLTGAILEQSNLADANLTRARLEAAALAQANLAGTNLRFARLERATLIGADLSGADLRAARLDGALLSRVVLHGADLTRASLLGAAILPDGTGLPPSDDGADWRTPFEAWAQSARLDEHGQVI